MSEIILKQYEIVRMDVVDSSNDEAKRLIKEEQYSHSNHKFVLVAGSQIAGKGRDRRLWISPEGNLYFSAVVIPNVPVWRLPQLSFVVAIAVKEALSHFIPKSAKITLKWPNDILVNNKKIAGILLESEYVGKDPKVRKVIIGVGINIKHCPEDLEIEATFAQAYMDQEIKLDDVLEKWIISFDQWFRLWEREGFTKIRLVWLANAHGTGKMMRVRFAQQEYEGSFKDVDQEGCLILQLPNGKEKTIAAGDVYFSI